MASSAATCVLRIGPLKDNASGTLLWTALLSHFESKDDPNNVLTMCNRYFSARVRLQDIHEAAPNDDTMEDGVILVFDALRSNPDIIGGSITASSSFDSLALVHGKADEANTCGELLRLCVGVYIGSNMAPSELRGSKHEEEYSRRIFWCLDRGYEYVEADLSQEGQETGHDERDKDGFARIVEAISGTVWSSAVMVTSKTADLKESYLKEKESLQEQEDETNPYVPPDPSLLVENSSAVSASTAETKKIRSSLVDEPNKVNSNDGLISDGNLTEQDQAMENLEGLLREASRIRQASRRGELADDERRKRASDAANLMMSLMNQLDGDDDDDGGDDSQADDEDDSSQD